MLFLVGLAGRAKHRVYELCGGEQQRVAIARVLFKHSYNILADELPGQLDSSTGRDILLFLREVVNRSGIPLVVAANDPKILDMVDSVHELVDGRLVNVV